MGPKTYNFDFNQDTNFYAEKGIDPIVVAPELVGTFNSITAAKLLASQKIYNDRTQCAFLNFSKSVVSSIFEVPTPYQAHLTYKYDLKKSILNLTVTCDSMSYQISNYKLVYATTQENESGHTHAHLNWIPATLDASKSFIKIVTPNGIVLIHTLLVTGGHSLDGIGKILG